MCTFQRHVNVINPAINPPGYVPEPGHYSFTEVGAVPAVGPDTCIRCPYCQDAFLRPFVNGGQWSRVAQVERHSADWYENIVVPIPSTHQVVECPNACGFFVIPKTT